ncbi:thiol-disulfide isomerase/thioredoxin [Gracilibacillus halotolerans]|uniref:Thiol-disulfide isomerase/thioredoxin n=1 Tax=Gracilibacillus halotolerans TaxID=74386 RepID=A0A841RLL2_9BACI|nr:thioredoxin family protein [Gracilibacillus halotolerans]MBB6513661.1 thiol-disulfide isomerase/thioredoxin [Gracilibacillus halotolerans]
METLQSKEQFQDWQQKEKVIFLFSADWCPDCRFIDPFMPEVEEKYSEWSFVFVDRDDFIEICQEHDIFGIPSFLAYHQGKELGRFVSKDRKTQEEIESFIEKLV